MNFTNTPLLERFQKIDPKLSVVDHGAEQRRPGKIRGPVQKTKWRPNIYQNKKLTKTPINLLLISQRLTFTTTSSSFFIRF
jgi:hypothetical protein